MHYDSRKLKILQVMMTRRWELVCFLCVKNHAFMIHRKREVKFNLFQTAEINERVASSYSDSAAREWTTTVTHSTGGWVELTVGLKKEKFLYNVVCTMHVYQVIAYKLVQHYALAYAAKLNSDKFRWRPPH